MHLDPESQQFQSEVDELVRRWAAQDPKEYWRRWKQLGSWSINRTQGDVVKKATLKKQLMAETDGHCMDCHQPFAQAALQMHRLDNAHAHDRATNFGYFRDNVVMVCAGCHEDSEALRRAGGLAEARSSPG